MLSAIVLILLVTLAGSVRQIVVLRERVRTLHAQAMTDTLTGAFNRRHMEASLRAAIERSRRSGECASLLLLDVDRFKDVNDAFGHAEGDRVLADLANVVQRRLRSVDALFRAGGDEFAVLLSGARFADAWSVAEDLRDLVQRARLLYDCEISISVGIAELARDHSLADWVAVADTALYRAKRQGRNRVVGTPQIAARRTESAASGGHVRTANAS
jgi:diguanylate cyclase (GGDEF)-like protein